MANSFVVVTRIEGQAWVRDADGNFQVLRVGMQIPMGAEVVTANGAKLELAGDEAGMLLIGENQSLQLADEFLQPPESSEAALMQPSVDVVDAVIQALNAGDDPLADLEPTAAVTGGGDGGGVSFVRLASVIESVNPLGLEYPRSSVGVPDEVRFSGVGEPLAENPEEAVTPPRITVVGGNPGDVLEGSGQSITTQVQIQAPNGVGQVLLNGVDVTNASQTPVTITTNKGTLVVTGFDGETLSYTYTENGQPKDHSGGDVSEQVTITVTDAAGQSTVERIEIGIVDTAPEARNDLSTLSEDAVNPITGTVLLNDLLGADPLRSVVFEHTQGQFGELVVDDDGTWTYTLRGNTPEVQQLNDGEVRTETFTYTITDLDGDSSTATLTIVIQGKTDALPTVNPVDSDGAVTPHHNHVTEATSETVGGSVQVSAQAGIQDVQVGEISVVGATATNPITIPTDHGTLRITGYDPVKGEISYTYTDNGQPKDHRDGPVVDRFEVTVTDITGQSTSGQLSVGVLDTAPVAQDDSQSIHEDAASVSGKVLANDTLGADC